MTAQKFDSEKLPLDLIDSGFARAVFNTPSDQPDPEYTYSLLDLFHSTADIQIGLRNKTIQPGHIEKLAQDVVNYFCWESPYDDLARVLDFGARKYAAENWRKGLPRARVLAAALRHMDAAERGVWVDEETGLPHLAHALCCLMFLWRYVVDGLDLPDDRWAKKEEPTRTRAPYSTEPLDIGSKARRGDVVRYADGSLNVANYDGLFTASETVARRPADLPAEYVAATVEFDFFESYGLKKGSVVWVVREPTGSGWKMWRAPFRFRLANTFAECWFKPIP